MRSLESTARPRRSGIRSSTWNTLAAAVVGISCLLGGSAVHAAPTLHSGSLSLRINVLPPILLAQAPDPFTNVSVTRNGGGALTGLTFMDTVFATTQFFIDVTDPAASPIRGIVATVMNGPADFGTTMGGFGGQMPLVGVNKVCLFGPCSAAVANLLVPVSVAGQGGIVFVTGAVNLTVIGAPWTTMTAAIGTITNMGNLVHSPLTPTPQDVVSLVTPVFVSTNIGASAVVPVFGFFDFSVPEPTTVAAFGASIAALVSIGLSRRRK